jgi:hypothetical protein
MRQSWKDARAIRSFAATSFSRFLSVVTVSFGSISTLYDGLQAANSGRSAFSQRPRTELTMKVMRGDSNLGFNIRAYMQQGGCALRWIQVAMYLSNQGRNDIENSF